MIKIKRIYDTPDENDGCRILVDRLWPRGLSRDKTKIDLWLKEIAPGDKLRKWYSHDVEKFSEFRKRYKQELRNKPELVAQIRGLEKKHKTITLLFSARDVSHNNSIVLRNYIKETLKPPV